MSARPPTDDSASPAGAVRRFVSRLRKPFAPIGFYVPGVRGRLLREVGRAEATIEQLLSFEEMLAQISASVDRLREEMAASRTATEKLTRSQDNKRVEDEILRDKLVEQLKTLHAVAERNARLEEREEAVKQREAFARETASRLQSTLESASTTQADSQRLLKEASGLYAGSQALLEEAHRRERDVREDEKALDVRNAKVEAFKIQLQEREQLVQRTQNHIATLEKERAKVEEELKVLKKQCVAEVAKGEEKVRDRERALVQREAEVGSITILVSERERALQERENAIRDREREIKRMEAELAALQVAITHKESQIATLEGTIHSLGEHRQQLQEMLAGLSARL